jgi:hypothetical protein
MAILVSACGGVPRWLNQAAALALELARDTQAAGVDVEAVLEALDRVGLSAPESSESADTVLLPHLARPVEPAVLRRGKPVLAPVEDQAVSSRKTKQKATRKKSA